MLIYDNCVAEHSLTQEAGDINQVQRIKFPSFLAQVPELKAFLPIPISLGLVTKGKLKRTIPVSRLNALFQLHDINQNHRNRFFRLPLTLVVYYPQVRLHRAPSLHGRVPILLAMAYMLIFVHEFGVRYWHVKDNLQGRERRAS